MHHVRRAIELNPAYAPAHARKARILLHQDRHDEALVAALESVRLAPSDVAGLQLLGDCHTKLEQWAAALKVFERAASQAPDNGSIQLKLAAMALRTHDPSRAETALRHTLSLDRRSAQRAAALLEQLASTGAVNPDGSR